MQQNNSKQSNHSEIELNFIEIVRTLLNSKRLIILTTIAVGGIGWLYSIYFNPTLPPYFESASVVEIGSYPKPTALDNRSTTGSYQGRILIASMSATTSTLNGIFGVNCRLLRNCNSSTNDIIQRVEIYELDSQFFKIEVDGATLDIVKNTTNEIIEYVKVLHDVALDDVLEEMKRQIKNVEEKLLIIDKYINYISDEQNDIYVSNVAELKLKEIEYKYELDELNRNSNNINSFKKTDLVRETQFRINTPESNLIKHVLASFLIGFILVSLFVLLRHALANNYKE